MPIQKEHTFSRIETEFSAGWIKNNPELFGERYAEWFKTYAGRSPSVSVSAEITKSGGLTLIAIIETEAKETPA